MFSELEKVQQPKLKKQETRVDKGAMELAASWYVAMESKALGKKPKAIEIFGQSLVAWRDQNGHPVIMERFCSHMGASLAIGQLKEGCIQCPFHHWRFDRTGQCVSIPEVDNIPPTAHQTTYVTVERYGYIWVWYGSKTPLFPLPEFSVVENTHNYVPWRYTFNTKTTVRRVIENVYDQYHLVSLHDLKVAESIQLTLLNEQHPELQCELPIKKEAWFGALIEVRIGKYLGKIGAVAQALGLNAEQFTVVADTWPSGNVITTSINGKERYKVLISTTPLTEKETIANVYIMVHKTGNFLLDLLYYVVFGLQTKATGLEDIPLWSTMNPNAGGAFVNHDLGVLKYRTFYQSWVDKVE
jgi:nitrite reductase/ring-hydroxylating ferredoxin subunit